MRTRHAQLVGLAHVSSGYLAINELGNPLRPERYSDHWKRLCEKAGVRVLTLHEARHTSVSLLRAKGIPDQIIAAFHGHDEQTMRRTYSHRSQKTFAGPLRRCEARQLQLTRRSSPSP